MLYILKDYLKDLLLLSKHFLFQFITICIDKLNVLQSHTPSNKLWECVTTTIKNIIRYFVFQVPDIIATIDNNILSYCLSFTDPFTSINNDNNQDFILDDIVYQQLWNYNNLIIDKIKTDHINFNNSITNNSNSITNPITVVDQFSSHNDIQLLYNKLFNKLTTNTSTVVDINTSSNGINLINNKLILLLCEYSISSQRSYDVYRNYLIATLLLKYSKDIISNINSNNEYNETINNNNNKPILQNSLILFLETYKPKVEEEWYNIIEFYGILIKYKLFSHDQFVRYLISKGILEQPQLELYPTLCKYLCQFPLYQENEIFQHEWNQRRAALLTCNYNSWLTNELDSIENCKSLITNLLTHINQTNLIDNISETNEFKELNNLLKKSSYYSIIFVCNWMNTHIKQIIMKQYNSNTSPLVFAANSPSVQSPISPMHVHTTDQLNLVIKIFELNNTIHLLIDLVIWLLQNNIPDQGYLISNLIRKYEFYFLCTDTLIDLPLLLFDKCKDATSLDSYYFSDLLIEFLDRNNNNYYNSNNSNNNNNNNNYKIINNWYNKHNQQIRELTIRINKQEMCNNVMEVMNINTFLNTTGTLLPLFANQIDIFNIQKETAKGAIKLIHDSLLNCLLNSSSNVNTIIDTLSVIFNQLPNQSSTSFKLFLFIIKEKLIETNTQDNSQISNINNNSDINNLSIYLYYYLVKKQQITLTQMITIIIQPILILIIKTIQDKDKEITNIPLLPLQLLQLLFGITINTNNNISTIIEFQHETVSTLFLFLNKKIQSQLTQTIIIMYGLLLNNSNGNNDYKNMIEEILISIIATNTFKNITTTNIVTEDFYNLMTNNWLKGVASNKIYKIIQTILQSNKNPVYPSIEDPLQIQLECKKLITNLTQWNYGVTMLQIQLLWNFWNNNNNSKESDKIMNGILIQEVVTKNNKEYSTLIAKLIGTIGNHFNLLNSLITTLQNILQTTDSITGKDSLKDSLVNEISMSTSNSSLINIELLKGIDNNNNEVDNNIVHFIIECITSKYMTNETRVTIGISLLEQLDNYLNIIQNQNKETATTITFIPPVTSIANSTSMSYLSTAPTILDWNLNFDSSMHIDTNNNNNQIDKNLLNYSLYLRSLILVPLLPFIKENKKSCKYEEFCRVILQLLSKSSVQSDDTLFSYLLNILDVLLNGNHSEEENKNQRILLEKLSGLFQDFELQPHIKTKLEQVLPIINITAPSTTIYAPLVRNKRTVDSWTILEDYTDAPLSPSMLGAEKIERKELTYAHCYVNDKPKRLRKE